MYISLMPLATTAFAIGVIEFIIVGFFPDLAHDLALSIPSTGLAVGAAVGTQLLAKLSCRMTIKSVLRKLTDVFVVGYIIWAQTAGYDVLMIARVLATYAFGIIMTLVQRSRSRLGNWQTAEVSSKGFCPCRARDITC